MNTWKSKLCGDNRLNFFGWIGTGLLVIIGSVYELFKAIQVGAFRSAEGLLLIAIYFLLLGHFGLALQNYCARVAKAIENDDEQKSRSLSASPYVSGAKPPTQ
jgi:hypothetical protein